MDIYIQKPSYGEDIAEYYKIIEIKNGEGKVTYKLLQPCLPLSAKIIEKDIMEKIKTIKNENEVKKVFDEVKEMIGDRTFQDMTKYHQYKVKDDEKAVVKKPRKGESRKYRGPAVVVLLGILAASAAIKINGGVFPEQPINDNKQNTTSVTEQREDDDRKWDEQYNAAIDMLSIRDGIAKAINVDIESVDIRRTEDSFGRDVYQTKIGEKTYEIPVEGVTKEEIIEFVRQGVQDTQKKAESERNLITPPKTVDDDDELER